MAGLFSSLSMAARSLEAQRAGLDTAGQNIANLNTPGYARRRLDLAEVTNGTGGVEVLGTRAMRDAVLDARARTAIPDEAREGAIVDTLALVETSIGAPGQSIDGRLAAFFDAVSALSVDPTSAVARDGVVLQGRQLTASFADVAGRLADSARLPDNGVRDAAAELNSLTAQIAELNDAIATGGGADVEAARPPADRARKTLGADLGGRAHARRRRRGRHDSLGPRPRHRRLVVRRAGGHGALDRLRHALAQQHRRDERVHERQDRRPVLRARHADSRLSIALGDIAYGVAQQVNTLHQAGFDLNGNAGVAFFTPPAAVAGAAANLAVNPALTANPSLVAASQTGAPGDNQIARQIAALRDRRCCSAAPPPSPKAGRSWHRVGADVDARARSSRASRTSPSRWRGCAIRSRACRSTKKRRR
jgi:flagellar hook-associated protein 1 FlgK